MNLVLRLAVLEPTPELPVTETQLAEARRARAVLNSAFALEETYDLLLSNFLELDQEALCAVSASVVRRSRSYEDFFEVRTVANRRVVNLLTAARLYLDHVPQHLANCTADPAIAKVSFKEATSAQYDAHFSYRFMEALRNHVQHSSLAVHTVSHASRWTGVEPATVLETRLELLSERRILEENRKFHAKVLAEMPSNVEILQAAREYLERLGCVHGTVRDLVNSEATAARQVFQALISSYAAVNDGRTLGLSVMKVHGVEREPLVSVFLNWDDVRLKLVQRNSTLRNLARRVPTSRLGMAMTPR